MLLSVKIVICFILTLFSVYSLRQSIRVRCNSVVQRMTNEKEGLGYFRLAGDEKEVGLELQTVDPSTTEEKLYIHLLYAYDNLPPDDIRELTDIIIKSNNIDIIRTRKTIMELIKNAEIIQEKIMSNAQGYSEEYLIDDLRVIRSQLRLNTRDLLPNKDDNYIEILNKMFTKKGK